MHIGWELPTSHFRVVAVGKAIDRVHARSKPKTHKRNPLTVPLLVAGGKSARTETFRLVTWMGIALSYFLLCRASELWAYDDGLVHADFCLRRGTFVFFKGVYKLAWDVRRQADRVEVTFNVSESDQKRQGAVVTREKVVEDTEGRKSFEKMGALKSIDFLDVHPELGSNAPIMQSAKLGSWAVVS
ncbi:unnamed protein product [Pylaiella littoralis]